MPPSLLMPLSLGSLLEFVFAFAFAFVLSVCLCPVSLCSLFVSVFLCIFVSAYFVNVICLSTPVKDSLNSRPCQSFGLSFVCKCAQHFNIPPSLTSAHLTSFHLVLAHPGVHSFAHFGIFVRHLHSPHLDLVDNLSYLPELA